MEFFPIATISDAMLISSNAPETDQPEYAAGTSYALGAFVQRSVAGVHRVYKSAVASNLGNTPELSTTQWIDQGPTNRWACFDQVIGTATALASPLTITIAPGQVDALALLELVGSSVTVTMTSASESGATVYSRTVSLDATVVLDYYDYFFADYEQRTTVVLTDLPPYGDGQITITLTGPDTVKLGMLAVGKQIDIGDVQLGAKAGIKSYSTKITDSFGKTKVNKLPNAKRPSFVLWVDKAAFNRVYRKLAKYDAQLCIWIGSQDPDYAEGLIACGIYKDFQLEATYKKACLCSLEIEGYT